MLDSADDVGSFIGVGALFGSLETPESRLDSLAAVSRDAVRDVARTLADPTRLNVVAVGLLDSREAKRLEETVMGFRGSAA
jgi:predicted Zn-dependent peptidase